MTILLLWPVYRIYITNPMDFAAILSSPIFWAGYALISELIGLNPKIKANSIVQLVMQGIASLKPHR